MISIYNPMGYPISIYLIVMIFHKPGFYDKNHSHGFPHESHAAEGADQVVLPAAAESGW